jgi:hypothetical protein
LDRWEQVEPEYQDSPMKGFDVDGGSMIEAGCRYDDDEWAYKKERKKWRVSIIISNYNVYIVLI